VPHVVARRRAAMVRARRPTVACLAALSFSAAPTQAYDWLQFNGDMQHSGSNDLEATVDGTNVAQLTVKFKVSLPAVADGAPAFLESVATPAGVKDLLFVTTRAGHVIALDAKTGAQVWSRQYAAGSCKINNGATPCYTTSSPAIDPSRAYVYSYGLDGFMHKHQVGDGVEITAGGWPQLTTAKPFDEKGSSALAIVSSSGNSYLYVAHGGYPGDAGDYQGHLTVINLASGTQNVFNVVCSNQAIHFARAPASADCPSVQSAIWARPGVVYDAATDRVFVATGNGNYNGSTGGYDWADSVLALNPDGTGSSGKPLDSYTPATYATLNSADADLGSAAPAILPVAETSNVQHLAVQAGKDAKLRLINLANLGGSNQPGHIGGEVGAVANVAQGGGVLPQPAVWVDPTDHATWLFVANGNGMSGLRLSIDANGNPSLVAQWHNDQGGSSALVANGVLYYAASNILRALDPHTGALLWSSSQIGGMHWESPVVANGVVFVTDDASQLTAFGLPVNALTTVDIIEFYNASRDHYFISSSPQEISDLDNGIHPGWVRTGLSFHAYTEAASGKNAVCRFYIPPSHGDSHFFSASPVECASILDKPAADPNYSGYVYESPNAFYIALPDTGSGACPAGATPVYRLWNQRAHSNHRYTTDTAIKTQMIAKGYVAEGYGPDTVTMCAPVP